jgi:hypothetical protein
MQYSRLPTSYDNLRNDKIHKSLVILIIMYIFGVGIYECYFGTKLYQLTNEYENYELIVNNNSVSIKDFDANVYKTIHTSSIVMLVCGPLSIFTVLIIILKLKSTEKYERIYLLFLNIIFMSLVPFVMAILAIQTFNSITNAETDTWNSIDVRFIDYLKMLRYVINLVTPLFGLWLFLTVIC